MDFSEISSSSVGKKCWWTYMTGSPKNINIIYRLSSKFLKFSTTCFILTGWWAYIRIFIVMHICETCLKTYKSCYFQVSSTLWWRYVAVENVSDTNKGFFPAPHCILVTLRSKRWFCPHISTPAYYLLHKKSLILSHHLHPGTDIYILPVQGVTTQNEIPKHFMWIAKKTWNLTVFYVFMLVTDVLVVKKNAYQPIGKIFTAYLLPKI